MVFAWLGCGSCLVLGLTCLNGGVWCGCKDAMHGCHDAKDALNAE